MNERKGRESTLKRPTLNPQRCITVNLIFYQEMIEIRNSIFVDYEDNNNTDSRLKCNKRFSSCD